MSDADLHRRDSLALRIFYIPFAVLKRSTEMGKLFVNAGTLLLASVFIGFAGADVFAGLYDFCDTTCTAGQCASCATAPCTGKGTTCKVKVDPSGCCNPGGLACTNSFTCAGKCGGVSPACSCGTVTGC